LLDLTFQEKFIVESLRNSPALLSHQNLTSNFYVLSMQIKT